MGKRKDFGGYSSPARVRASGASILRDATAWFSGGPKIQRPPLVRLRGTQFEAQATLLKLHSLRVLQRITTINEVAKIQQEVQLIRKHRK